MYTGLRPKTKLETNYDRPGSTYSTIPMTENKPERCAARCLNDSACWAYTFAPPGVGTGPKCYLKNTFAAKVDKAGYTSGLVLKWKVEAGTERAVDSRYRTFSVPVLRPEYCALECQDDAKCLAYSFMAALAGRGFCNLLSTRPLSTENSSAISGVRPQ